MADLLASLQSAAGVSTGNPNAWDISKAYYDVGSKAGDISKSLYPGNSTNSFSVASQDTSPADVFFKPDGSKMYMIGGVNDSVYEYTLSTPWLVTSSSYVQSFSVTSQDTSPSGLFFKPDGTKMYVSGAANDSVYEYSLSSAWDISTASYVQSFSVATEEISPQALFFKPDGTKMYVIGTSGDDVNEYDLSTAWDISTASYLQNFSVATEETGPIGISFLDDGTKMYVIGSSGDDINQYDLSTPWDVSTASYIQNFSVVGQSTLPQGLYMKGDGSRFYMIDAINYTVYQYHIGGFIVGAQDGTPVEIFFKDDGLKMYVIGAQGQDINEYDLSVAWDINTATYLQNFSVSGQEISPRGLFFKSDGTKMYVTGQTGDDVNEYSLATAWDISTASYSQVFSISAQETSPQGLFFKPDGTKMYVSGNTGDDINEYSLSTPWDVSTASYVQNFSVASQDTVPNGLFFKDDGTKMYVIGAGNDKVYEYDLSSAWDISTASYLQEFAVINEQNTPHGLFFKPDGTQFIIIGATFALVSSYLISEE